MSSTTTTNRSQSSDRIAAAKAREHRAGILSSLLLNHGQDVDVLKAVPTEALEGMLAALDAGKAAVAAAQADAAKAKTVTAKASTRLAEDEKAARRIRRTLSLNPDGTLTKSQELALRVVMNPACEGEKGWNLSNYRDMLAVLMSRGLLHPDYRNRLIDAMNTGRVA